MLGGETTMSHHALLICRSQTEAIGLRRHLLQFGIMGEVTRPPRHERTESCGYAVRIPAGQVDGALRRLRQLGLTPCRVTEEESV